MRTLAIITAVSMLLASTAVASVISDSPYYEVEANNTIPLGLGNNLVGAFSAPGGSFLADGVITAGDVDYYAFTVPGATHLVAAVYALPNSDYNGLNDSMMQLVDGGGFEWAFDDDDNIGFMSSLEADIPGGTYLIGITGYSDRGFVGEHEKEFGYKLIVGVNTVPEPSTIALLAGGLLLGLRRRVR